MAKFRQVQSSFAYGMLSEEAAARTDLDYIKQGCAELTNFVVEPIGGIRKRIGSRLVSSSDSFNAFLNSVKYIPIKGSTNLLRIDETKDSTPGVTTYHIYLYDKNHRFLSAITSDFSSGIVGKPLSIIQIGDVFVLTTTKTEPLVIFPKTQTEYSFTTFSKYLIGKATDLASKALRYKFTPFNAWNINQSETIQAEATSGNTYLLMKRGVNALPFFSPLNSREELIAANYYDTTWKRALWTLPFTTNDPFVCAITQTAPGKWTGTVDSTPVDTINTVSCVEMVCTSSTKNSVVEVGKTYFANFSATGGNHVRIASNYEDLIAGTFISDADLTMACEFTFSKIARVLVATIIAPPNTNATYSWAESEWNPKSGYPKKVSFVGTRMCFAGSNTDSEAIWLSGARNIFQMNNLRYKIDETATSSEVDLFGAIGDTDAHKTRATSAQFNRTSWILNADELTVGCDGGIFILNRSNTGDYLPQKTTSSALSYDSAADVEPTMMEFGIVFVDSSKTRLKFIDFRSDKKGVNDISLLVTELFTDIKKIVYQRSTKTLWILDGNTLKSFTLSTFTNVAGFAQHSINFLNDSLDDIFADQDDKLNVVYRSSAGFVTVLRFEKDINSNNSVYLDCFGSKISGVATSTWDFVATETRLTRLIGQTIPCYVDGVACVGTVVNSLRITTPISGLNLVFGNSYTARMVTVSLDPDGVLGSSVGAMKRPDEVVLKVKNTKGMKVGGKTLYDSKLTANLYSGDVVEKVAADPSLTSKITVESTGNNPCHILGITYKGLTQE